MAGRGKGGKGLGKAEYIASLKAQQRALGGKGGKAAGPAPVSIEQRNIPDPWEEEYKRKAVDQRAKTLAAWQKAFPPVDPEETESDEAEPEIQPKQKKKKKKKRNVRKRAARDEEKIQYRIKQIYIELDKIKKQKKDLMDEIAQLRGNIARSSKQGRRAYICYKHRGVEKKCQGNRKRKVKGQSIPCGNCVGKAMIDAWTKHPAGIKQPCCHRHMPQAWLDKYWKPKKVPPKKKKKKK